MSISGTQPASHSDRTTPSLIPADPADRKPVRRFIFFPYQMMFLNAWSAPAERLFWPDREDAPVSRPCPQAL